MKKLLIPVILIGAVCLLFRQPEYYGAGEISTEQNTYDLYEKDNYLYIKRDKKYGKIFGEEIIDYKIYNIDSDIDEEILVITKHEAGEFGSDFIIYDTKEADGTLVAKEIYRHDFSNIKPWKVDACNLDNDGQADIFIGVYKDTVFYKDVRRRPFFYSSSSPSIMYISIIYIIPTLSIVFLFLWGRFFSFFGDGSFRS
jgi:hypothetical protein